MELFQSIDEGREADFGGRAAHAFALGNALGLIRFIPGGRDWGKNRGIANTGWQRIKMSSTKKKPYEDYDLSSQKSRTHLLRFAEQQWGALGLKAGSKFFNGKLPKNAVNTKGDPIKINDISDLKSLANNQHDAQYLVNILKGFEYEWKKNWAKRFFQEAGGDLAGSLPRMLAGTMAFNYELVFDDTIPLELSLIHI